MNKRWLAVIALVAGALVVLPTSAAVPAFQQTTSASPGWVTTAQRRLARLDTKPAASKAGSARGQFGRKWFDVDLNGCSTRNDILARDLRQVVFDPNEDCVVATGVLNDPYTGKTINFVQGKNTSSAVQIDHVVALAAAWRTGAKQWTPDERLFYANDSLVLLAVDGPTNSAKGDQDAAGWTPPNDPFDCRYVARQIAIKTKYELWVTQSERTAMTNVLDSCYQTEGAMMLAWQWFWDTPSWNWSYFWAAVALLVPTIATLAYRLVSIGSSSEDKKNPRPIIDLVNGRDGRWSTSKTTALLWTVAVAFALLAILVHTAGDIDEVFGDFQAEYLLVLGLPIGTALAARGITGSHVDSGAITTKPETDKRETNPINGVAQLFANDEGRTDLGDTQYLLFSLVLLSWFLLTFFVQKVDQLPDLPDTLLGLTSVSALAYVTKKGLDGEGGPTIRSVVPAAAKPRDTIEIRGVNFATAADLRADVLFNNVPSPNSQVQLFANYASIKGEVPSVNQGTVELRVVASDGRRSEPADFEVL